MCADRPRLFTIPPGAAFLPTLVDALFVGALVPGWPDAADPLSLSQGTIFVPTRRAARALAALIAQRAGEGAVLLPRIVPLGDVDEAEETQLLDGLSGIIAGKDFTPPPTSDSQRRIALAKLILHWARTIDRALLKLDKDEPLLVPASPADAVALAGDLGALIDTLAIYGRGFEDVNRLVPGEHSRYWDISRQFLVIAAEHWPKWCDERGVTDAAVRRHRLLLAEAARLTRLTPDAPMVAAGSTGSMPATAALLSAIARLPRGAVVLPGLDLGLDAPAWTSIPARSGARVDPGHPTHPQAVLAALLERMSVERDAVSAIGTPPPPLSARDRFLSEALRPAETTHLWTARHERVDAASIAAALADVTYVEAADDREEATVVAAVLREALATPGRTAALITPDRALAARVCAEMRRWNVQVDDSAGRPLGDTLPGLLARLAAAAAAENFAAGALLDLLAHPLCRLGLPPQTRERARRALEIGVLRGPTLDLGLAALRGAIAPARERCAGPLANRPQRRLGPADWEALEPALDRLEAAFAAFVPAPNADVLDLTLLPAQHEAVLAALAAPADEDEGDLFAGEAGEALATLFDELRESAGIGLEGRFADYPAFFDGLLAGRTVRAAGGGHPRLRIWGLLEARLLTCDVVALAGLDEKTWPAETRGDPFLNRQMRHALGLPAPERRIGQMAHDFVQALGASRIVVTRAQKRGGDPTVVSRFIQRMQAVAGETAWRPVRQRGADLLAVARLIDRAGPARPVGRPRPRPRLDLVPRRLSVTEIETLVRDPYSIYAKHVLELDPLDRVAAPPDASLKGVLVHDAAAAFVEAFPAALPADAVDRLLAIGRRLFDAAPQLRDRPDVAAVWWPRFARIAAWLADWEARRRADGPRLFVERRGELPLVLDNGEIFVLTGRADRLELTQDGGLRVVDFKTGQTPRPKVVRLGFSPQLTLEAAMAKGGAFKGLPPVAAVRELLYVKLSGGGEPGEDNPVRDTKAPFDVDALSDEHLAGLRATLSEFVAGERAFVSRPLAQYARRYTDYDHLARVLEWSLVGGDSDGEDGEA